MWVWLIAQTITYTVALFPPAVNPAVGAPVAVLGTFLEADWICPSVIQVLPMSPSPVVVPNPLRLQAQWEGTSPRICETPSMALTAVPRCAVAPCPTYALGVTASIGTALQWAQTTLPLVMSLPATTPVPPECLWPQGNRAVSVFPTNRTLTAAGQAGSRAVQNFQLASPNSPITLVLLRIDGVVVATIPGDDLTRLPGWWIVLPASGTHTVTIQATNSHGCTLERAAAPLVVP